MGELVINDSVRIDITSFYQSFTQASSVTLSVNFNYNSYTDDLSRQLQSFLEEGSIESIKIYFQDELIYTTDIFNKLNYASFGRDFRNDENNSGSLSFEVM